MAKASSLNITYAITGDGLSVTFAIPIAVQNAASPAQQQAVTLAAGANTLAVPAGAVGALIVPPATSTNTKTLKGVTGDTGIPLAPAQPVFVPLPSGAVSFVLTSAGAEVVSVHWI